MKIHQFVYHLFYLNALKLMVTDWKVKFSKNLV